MSRPCQSGTTYCTWAEHRGKFVQETLPPQSPLHTHPSTHSFNHRPTPAHTPYCSPHLRSHQQSHQQKRGQSQEMSMQHPSGTKQSNYVLKFALLRLMELYCLSRTLCVNMGWPLLIRCRRTLRSSHPSKLREILERHAVDDLMLFHSHKFDTSGLCANNLSPRYFRAYATTM